MGSFCGKPVADEQQVPKASVAEHTVATQIAVEAVVPGSAPVPVAGPSDASSPVALAADQIVISVVPHNVETTHSSADALQDIPAVLSSPETVDPVKQSAHSNCEAQPSSSDAPAASTPTPVAELSAEHIEQPEDSTLAQPEDTKTPAADVIETPTAVSPPQPSPVPSLPDSEANTESQIPITVAEASPTLQQAAPSDTSSAAAPVSTFILAEYMWTPTASEGGSGVVPPVATAVVLPSAVGEALAAAGEVASAEPVDAGTVHPAAVEAASATVEEVAQPIISHASDSESEPAVAVVDVVQPVSALIAQPEALEGAQPTHVEVVALAVVDSSATADPTAIVLDSEESQQSHSTLEKVQLQEAVAVSATPATTSTPAAEHIAAAVQPCTATTAVIAAAAPVAASPVVAVRVIAAPAVATPAVIAPVAATAIAKPVRSTPVAMSAAAPSSKATAQAPAAPTGPPVKTAAHGLFHSRDGQLTTRTRVMVDFLPKKDAQEVLTKLGASPQEAAEEKTKPTKAAAAAAAPGAAVAKGKAKAKGKGKGKK